MSARYIVTGDRGFVGSHLRRRLLALGHEVIGIGRSPVPTDTRQHARYTGWVLDLADRGAVAARRDEMRSAAAVFHLAARLPQGDDDPLEPHTRDNVRTVEHLLEVLDGSGMPLVLSSTMSVFGESRRRLPVTEDAPPDPAGAYGRTKLEAEEAARRFANGGGGPVIVLRYPGIFGPGYHYGAIHLYASQVLSRQTAAVYGAGRIVRDYVHVDDVVEANLLAARRLQQTMQHSAHAGGTRYDPFRIYHIGGGEPLPLARVAGLVVEAVGRGHIEINQQPGPCDFAFDITRAWAELGYMPRPLAARIRQYVRELQESQP